MSGSGAKIGFYQYLERFYETFGRGLSIFSGIRTFSGEFVFYLSLDCLL